MADALKLLPFGSRDDAAEAYLATLKSPASAQQARSLIETAARALLSMSPQKKPTRIGARGLHLDLSRVPWSSVTAEDSARVRDVLVYGPRSARSAAAIASALKGVLRAAGSLTLQHVDALRIEGQMLNGRTVRDVVAAWDADDRAAMVALFDSDETSDGARAPRLALNAPPEQPGTPSLG